MKRANGSVSKRSGGAADGSIPKGRAAQGGVATRGLLVRHRAVLRDVAARDPLGRRRAGAVLVFGIVAGGALLVALGGEAVAGHDPAGIVAPPWTGPAPGLPLGADGLGRDVLARVLAGGRDLTLTSLAATLTASALGVAGGLWVGWSRSHLTRAVAGAADLLLALPLLLLALLAVVAWPGPAAVVVGTVLGGTPLTLRVVADATAAAKQAGYVEAALSRGERGGAVLLREVLPAHAGLVGADLGQRLVLAVQLAAALNVLGFGPAPPAPDWAAMLRENLQGLGLNPAATIAPAVALAVLAGSVAALSHVIATWDGLS
ncbi:ABC transporter permease subunit [Nonomuraea basaltis]|uniref:ABC transporter permease subunit n=1 Tax=Nonomuraea basaltis TaxID=2495887 RepID=UPI00110C6C12|nr:ABC transporter permease subunit [Nonomuraea basaltis]TMR89676.1 ABC transporter permease subunit [Nonomuraea basaltis]